MPNFLPNARTVIFAIVLVTLACGCSEPKNGSQSGIVSAEPKSSYGKAIKSADGLQTPSAEQQSQQQQADELLED